MGGGLGRWCLSAAQFFGESQAFSRDLIEGGCQGPECRRCIAVIGKSRHTLHLAPAKKPGMTAVEVLTAVWRKRIQSAFPPDHSLCTVPEVDSLEARPTIGLYYKSRSGIGFGLSRSRYVGGHPQNARLVGSTGTCDACEPLHPTSNIARGPWNKSFPASLFCLRHRGCSAPLNKWPDSWHSI